LFFLHVLLDFMLNFWAVMPTAVPVLDISFLCVWLGLLVVSTSFVFSVFSPLYIFSSFVDLITWYLAMCFCALGKSTMFSFSVLVFRQFYLVYIEWKSCFEHLSEKLDIRSHLYANLPTRAQRTSVLIFCRSSNKRGLVNIQSICMNIDWGLTVWSMLQQPKSNDPIPPYQ
jgi:hypothetical protein